ncbi:predicted protein [Histoplasma mississippiense (nom. inval.)]|nr:predicted protein [Histoplasma mississippiense (nom. inval.)]EDN05716.1 predicted protein [Histoplasma mississippiense (nom. inval.)]
MAGTVEIGDWFGGKRGEWAGRRLKAGGCRLKGWIV